ncbi:hypothetical protein TanjilG_02794 [Lupinus angustifolius]|uniref:FLZ-type domain-containing protein n=1 Tax=Lupinus angustifolius TaxID=3871 RepID=A0A1J7INF5_LUPAN|nr:PREDICTED: uncharacterized protein LOC109338138 [Lupinus angustifolius]OIW16588.1 hypothetical protein TanjilG_02794 [Lupinus angustifolius]
MLLGKRPRNPMKRTTSMSEIITFDLNTSIDVEPKNTVGVSVGGLDQNNRVQRRHSFNSVETPEFLRACSLCKRCLVPGRDIYMYRGDSAFCSTECRQQRMKHDERKEKFIVASNKKQQVVNPTPPSGSQVATKGETVAAL